ncbi:hypothetical protein H9P43_009249 [Blastocladiella emersonii ATCC 22665]|nr:hypothetical protein H9P43_009249 [Blastocladiella emersonii ATCC 22665]
MQSYTSIPQADPLQFYAASYGQPPHQQPMQQQGGGGYGYASGAVVSGSMSMGPAPTAYGVPPPANMGTMGGGNAGGIQVNYRAAFGSGALDGEPPLLEELGINFGHIRDKAVTALNPFRPIQRGLMDDTDLAGPLLFCLLFGMFLLLSGKVHFSYIYGLGAVGCLSMYAILNLMSDRGVDVSTTASVLGYCLLPMVLQSMVTALLSLSTLIGLVLSCVSVCWCTYSASTMFVTVLSMTEQRVLVAYPVGLLYAVFALLTIF